MRLLTVNMGLAVEFCSVLGFRISISSRIKPYAYCPALHQGMESFFNLCCYRLGKRWYAQSLIYLADTGSVCAAGLANWTVGFYSILRFAPTGLLVLKSET